MTARTLTPSAIRELAARHGVRPTKSLGQHFLIEPTLARRIVELAGVSAGDHVVEVGAGLGSLTVALAEAGADVVAIEVDRRLIAALEDVTAPWPSVRVVEADALSVDWSALLGTAPAPVPWSMVANLPYNVSVPLVIRVLEEAPHVERLLVMVQKEVGERLAAGPGRPGFGAVSLKVAYHADAKVVRRVSRSVFWPEPNVDSVLVALARRPPPIGSAVDPDRLFALIRTAFAERRKTMRNALVRFGLAPERALAALSSSGIAPSARPESLGLPEFAALTAAIGEGQA